MNSNLKLFFIYILCVPYSYASSELKNVSIQLSWFNQFQFAGYYMAKEKGFYKELGLNVEIKPFNFSVNTNKDINENKTDFAIGREILVLERAKNKNIVALFALFQTSPLILISTKDSKINLIKDFKNKRIMATIDDAGEVSLKAMIKSNKVDLNDLNFLKHTHNVNDLINKKTDVISAYISKAPFILEKMSIPYNIFEPKEYGFDMYSDILYTSESLIKKDIKLVKAFKKASLKGWQYAYSNIDESVQLIEDKYNTQNLSKEELIYEAKELKKLSFYNDVILGDININKLKRITDLYNIMGLLNSKIDLNKIIYNKSNYNLIFTQKEQEYLKNKKIIKMSINNYWMPYEKLDKDGKHVGISADYFKIFQKDIPIPIKLIETKTLAQSMEYVKNRKCDILSLSVKTKKRLKYLNFTDSYFNTSYVLATKLNVPFIDNINDLKNLKVGIIKASSFKEILKNKYPFIEIVEFDNIEEGLKEVTKGKIFAFSDSLATIGYLLQKEFFGVLQVSGKFDKYFKLGIAVRNDDKILLGIFNTLIEDLPFEVKEKIFNQHISVKYESKFDYILPFEIFLVFLLILFLFLYRYKLMEKYTNKIEKYLEIVDSHVLISYTDTNGVITSVSEALCNLSGYTKDELIGKKHSIFRHVDMPDSLYKDMWITIINNNFWQGEIKNLNKDGTHYWADVKITAIYDNHGIKKGYSSITENITDKKNIEKLSVTDALTQIPNRLYLDKSYEKESLRVNRHGTTLALILMDIDFFKKINDTYGHKIGDDVLVEIAKLIKNNIRGIDVLGRWGGEEFLIICPETNIFGAVMLAGKIRKVIENYKFKEVNKITCSFGVTEYYKNENIEESFNRADKALYIAKEQGRNKVISEK
ncbi:MAG: diguanylate cyclase [Campylobacteraceae bacterium]|nr:diguanylate cyclase [Campylobacteraceae bacterium]